MPSELTKLEIFREASLRSGLVTSAQWKEVAREALHAAEREQIRREKAGRSIPSDSGDRSGNTKPDGTSETDPASMSEQACGRISDALIAHGIVTSYQAQQLMAGRTKLSLGNYRITDWLGQGGMGQVFAGVHEIMGRRCAIKVLPLDKATDESRQSFMREIRLQAALDCPYLVRAFDAGRDGSVHYLVTELIEGTDLRQWVKQNGPLTMQQAASIIAQAAAGLAYAHDSGLVHRDIKPANILVTRDGHAKVSDVGLAALTSRPGHDNVIDDDPRAGKIVGTADYLSPEQIRTPDNVGPASDIYSLGCTLYFAVTGKVPFPGGDTRDKCKRHLSQTPWHPQKYAPDISDAFADTIADMMEKSIDRRIASATDVVSRLSPWAAAETPEGDSDWLSDMGLTSEDIRPAVPEGGQRFRAAEGNFAIASDSAIVVLDEPCGSSAALSAIGHAAPPPPGEMGSHEHAIGSTMTRPHYDPLAATLPPPPPPIHNRRHGVSWTLAATITVLFGIMTGLAGWLAGQRY